MKFVWSKSRVSVPHSKRAIVVEQGKLMRSDDLEKVDNDGFSPFGRSLSEFSFRTIPFCQVRPRR